MWTIAPFMKTISTTESEAGETLSAERCRYVVNIERVPRVSRIAIGDSLCRAALASRQTCRPQFAGWIESPFRCTPDTADSAHSRLVYNYAVHRQQLGGVLYPFTGRGRCVSASHDHMTIAVHVCIKRKATIRRHAPRFRRDVYRTQLPAESGRERRTSARHRGRGDRGGHDPIGRLARQVVSRLVAQSPKM